MSENHRPTYTAKDAHKSFNATQVRLYGIPGISAVDDKDDEIVTTGVLQEHAVIVAKLAKLSEEEPEESEELDDFRISDIKTKLDAEKNNKSTYTFVDSVFRRFMLMIGCVDIEVKKKKKDKNIVTCGIIFGYAYEGHAYDLPKPKIMLIPAAPEAIFPVDDSGYKAKEGARYRVWIVDKLDKCIEIDVNQGFVEQIVLDANLPGKRSPAMYASRMLMGSKSGRLGE